jgi:chemotaxis response regulator CheB
VPTKVAPRRPPRGPGRIQRPASVAAIGPSSGGAAAFLVVLLGLGLGVSALVAAVALAPAKALPELVADRLDGHREVLISASAALAVGVAAGLVVVALS